MLLKLILFCSLSTAARASGLDIQAPLKAAGQPYFDAKSTITGPTTISHKSFIEHVAPGTGSAGGSSHQQSSAGSRSSTLLNKAIAGNAAVPDPSRYTNVQVTPPNFSIDPIGIPSLNYADKGILSSGSIDTSAGSSSLSLNSFTGNAVPGSISVVPNGFPALSNDKDGILSVGFLDNAFGKSVVSMPGIISVTVSSSTDHDSPVNNPASPVTINHANDGVLSTTQIGTSVGEKAISIPNAVPESYIDSNRAAGSISGNIAVANPVSSSIGPAESSFLSSLGVVVDKPSAITTSDSITSRNVAAVQNEAASVKYSEPELLAGPVALQKDIIDPTTQPLHTSISKYLSTPASDLLGLLSRGYITSPSGIPASGFLGTPISSVFGLTGKELSANGLFSTPIVANTGNLGVEPNGASFDGNKDSLFNNFETVIQHTAPANAAANPTSFSGLTSNNLLNGLTANGIFADPLGFPNGLFGSAYGGINIFGGERLALDNIFSKYLWR